MKTQNLLPGVLKQIELFRRDYRNGKQLANRYLEFINSTEDRSQRKPRGIHVAKPKLSLEEMTIRQLRKVAGSFGIPKYSCMTRAQLLKAIQVNHETTQN